MQTIIWLVEGAVLGGLFAVIARQLGRYSMASVGGMLIVAAIVYVCFAVRAATSFAWLGVELVGVVGYGALAVQGMRLRSRRWLAAGWALHPVWDMALHYFGPGHEFAPTGYAIICLSFDLVVAVIVLVPGNQSDFARAAREVRT